MEGSGGKGVWGLVWFGRRGNSADEPGDLVENTGKSLKMDKNTHKIMNSNKDTTGINGDPHFGTFLFPLLVNRGEGARLEVWALHRALGR